MSKFTRKSTCSEQNLSIHENAATYTCSNRDNDNIFFALCSTNPRFPKSRCIRIIKHFCRNMEFLLHHLSNRDQPVQFPLGREPDFLYLTGN